MKVYFINEHYKYWGGGGKLKIKTNRRKTDNICRFITREITEILKLSLIIRPSNFDYINVNCSSKYT